MTTFYGTNSALAAYLDGRDFASSWPFDAGSLRHPNRDRVTAVVARCEKQAVLHIGFADHEEVIADKSARGQWLHGRLLDVATSLIGIDVESAVVQRLCAQGFEDLYALDILTDPLPLRIAESTFECLVIGEVLEHCDNPVHFLKTISDRTDLVWRRMIVTVPNAYGLQTLRSVVRGREVINTDHRYWFSPYTLMKVATAAGLEVAELELADTAPPQARRGVAERTYLAMLRRNPLLRPCLVAVLQRRT